MNRRRFLAGLLASAAVLPEAVRASMGRTLTVADIREAVTAVSGWGVPPLSDGRYVCFMAPRATGPITLNGLRLLRRDLGGLGRALYAGDLVAGRTYEVALDG